MEKVIDSYPAYDVIERDPLPAHAGGVVEVKYGEKLGLKVNYSGGSFYREYIAGSVISYALKSGDDPIASLARAVKNGHGLHWLNQSATCISNQKRAKYSMVKIEVGQKIKFEGRIFEIIREPNSNLGLKEIANV